jgi:transcription elongation factor SPT5
LSAKTNKISLVPEEEYYALFRSPTVFVPEEWVRLAKGKYKGDLALVTNVDKVHRTCKAFYVPRLDLDGKTKSISRGKRKMQPQQVLFDPIVVKSAKKRVNTIDKRQNIYKYGKKTYVRGLIMEEELSFDDVVQTRVIPTYEEFYMFHKSGILDIQQYDRILSIIEAHSVKEGTKVTVILGQQQGLKGTVKELVDQSTVRIEPTAEDGANSSTVDVPIEYIKISDYEMGDWVVVVRGEKKGMKGLVVETRHGCVVIHDGKSKQTVRLNEH